MAAAKKSGSANQGRGRSLAKLLPILRNRLVLALLMIALFSTGVYGIWHRVSRQVLAADSYWLSSQNVDITPPADWIHRDVRAEVFRDASLDGPLWLMDENLVQRLANAFKLHPCVASVSRVQKYHPARVKVDLVYRRPVCMVNGLLPVDGDGVLLPPDDFSAVERTHYPWLVNIPSRPMSSPGNAWGDPRVTGGALLAAALEPAWQRLAIDRIAPLDAPDRLDLPQTTYELFTRGGSRVIWGHAPGAETAGEPAAAGKLAQLQEYRDGHGSLDGPHGPQQFDLRRLPSPAGPPR